jgi:hypothetical protein
MNRKPETLEDIGRELVTEAKRSARKAADEVAAQFFDEVFRQGKRKARKAVSSLIQWGDKLK